MFKIPIDIYDGSIRMNWKSAKALQRNRIQLEMEIKSVYDLLTSDVISSSLADLIKNLSDPGLVVRSAWSKAVCHMVGRDPKVCRGTALSGSWFYGQAGFFGVFFKEKKENNIYLVGKNYAQINKHLIIFMD